MADNTLGTVQIVIRGDWSKLPADFQAAGQFASQAGVQISGSFTQATVSTKALEDEIRQLGTVIRETSAASDLATQRNMAMTRGLQQFGQAAAGAHLNTRFLIFGLKDLAEGRGTYAMAELVNVLRGFGPVVLAGAASLGILAAAFYGPIAAAKELAAEIEKTNKEVDDGLEKSLRAIESLNVKSQELQFGGAAGKRLEGIYSQQAYQSDLDKVHVLTHELQEMSRQAGTFKVTDVVPYLGSKDRANEQKAIVDKQAEIEKLLEGTDLKRRQIQLDEQDAARLGAQQAGALAAAKIGFQEAQLKHQSELNKGYFDDELQQSHAVIEAQIAGYHSRQVAAVSEAQEELRVQREKEKELTAVLADEVPKRIALIRALGAAEAYGKTGPEQAVIGQRTQTAVETYQTEADKRTLDQQRAVAEATAKVATASVTAIREETKAQKDFNIELDHEVARWKEITAKQSEAQAKLTERLTGVHPETRREEDRLEPVNQQALQRLQGGNAVQQQLALAIQLKQVGIETGNEIQSRIGNLQQELSAAQRLNVPIQTRLNLEKEILDAKIAAAAENGQTDQADKLRSTQVQIQQTLTQWKSLDLGDVAESSAKAVISGVDGISKALAGAIIQGKHFGQAISQAGKQVAGSILTSVIEVGLKRVLASLLSLVPAFGAVGAAQAAAAATAKAATSVTDVGEATGNAAVAATGAAAAVAFIPIIGPALAAAAAASTFAALSPYIGLAAFADGGRPPVGVASIVGERGPELFIPDHAGAIIPAGQFGALGGGGMVRSGDTTIAFNGPMHFHGVQNVRGMMRGIADYAKSQNPNASAYAR